MPKGRPSLGVLVISSAPQRDVSFQDWDLVDGVCVAQSYEGRVSRAFATFSRKLVLRVRPLPVFRGFAGVLICGQKGVGGALDFVTNSLACLARVCVC